MAVFSGRLKSPVLNCEDRMVGEGLVIGVQHGEVARVAGLIDCTHDVGLGC